MSDSSRSPPIETKQTLHPKQVSTLATSQPLPPELLEIARSRIQTVSGFMLGTFLVVWLITLIVGGNFVEEFQDPAQWGPSLFLIVSSALVFGLTHVPTLPASKLLGIGWTYQVAVSFGLGLAQYLRVFDWVPPEQINIHQFGMSWPVLWMFFFTVLVPARPRLVLIALLASAAAVPATYLLALVTVRMPSVSSSNFLLVLVLPYFVTAIAAYVASRTLYRLRIEALQARQLGAYRLDSLIGRGGMGEVWRGTHRLLARPAAIKLIRENSLGSDPTLVSVAVARFEREAQVTASLSSPHTVELYDFGTAQDGTLYYVMELLNGIDLERLVRQDGAQPPERVVPILRQVCTSLVEAHRRGLVHRDIKPANIYLCRLGVEYDFVKVLDFGLVKQVARIEGDRGLNITQANLIPGTPSFMPPEATRGEELDGRADLYALGCVAYWLLTGRLVFEEPTSIAMLAAHASKQPVPPSKRAEFPIPHSLDQLVLACLEKDPINRIQTSDELMESLAKVELEEPWSRERALRWWEAFGVWGAVASR